MTQTNETIERFSKMAEADPTNELGHFSLGKALLDAGRVQEAAMSFRRVIELNPEMSKAYQLLGGALLRLGERGPAIDYLTQGVKTAHRRGEFMPRDEMIAQLKSVGAPIPVTETAQPAQAAGAGEVLCKRCGKVGKKLPAPPMRNAFGKEVFENICVDCWRAAVGQGTKVINELRLPMDDPQANKLWDQHIREFLNLSQA